MQQAHILSSSQLNKGGTKIVKINDEKTVFKYNYDIEKYGNQINTEIKIYQKFYNQYKDILPKIYSIVERKITHL